MSDYTLYGYTLSYFTRKLEAALHWYGAPFVFQLKTPDVKGEVEKQSGTHQVPVLRTPDGRFLADTTPLLWELDGLFSERRMFPRGPEGVVVQLIEEWFDEWIPRTAIYYRWQIAACAEVAQAQLGKEAAPAAAAVVGQMIAQWGGKAARALGVTEAPQQMVAVQEYTAVLEQLNAQLAHSRFALGDRPCAVDAVILGGLRAHFFADSVPRKLVSSYPRVLAWIEDDVTWDGEGELASFPETTVFGRYILAQMLRDYTPMLEANRAALAAGDKAFCVATGGVQTSYRTRSYLERSRQMACERIAQLSRDWPDTGIDMWLKDHQFTALFGAS
jgi:glutathione S-transferase